MTRNKMLIILARDYPDAEEDELTELLAEWEDEQEYPEDTDCLQDGRDNCDDWGTGEGRYHGRI